MTDPEFQYTVDFASSEISLLMEIVTKHIDRGSGNWGGEELVKLTNLALLLVEPIIKRQEVERGIKN